MGERLASRGLGLEVRSLAVLFGAVRCCSVLFGAVRCCSVLFGAAARRLDLGSKDVVAKERKECKTAFAPAGRLLERNGSSCEARGAAKIPGRRGQEHTPDPRPAPTLAPPKTGNPSRRPRSPTQHYRSRSGSSGGGRTCSPLGSRQWYVHVHTCTSSPTHLWRPPRWGARRLT